MFAIFSCYQNKNLTESLAVADLTDRLQGGGVQRCLFAGVSRRNSVISKKFLGLVITA